MKNSLVVTAAAASWCFSCRRGTLISVTIAVTMTSYCFASLPGLSFYPCEQSTMVQCLQGLRTYTGNQSLSRVYHNKTAVYIICKEFNDSLACMDSYLEQCAKGADTSNYDKIVHTVKQIIGQYCKFDLTKEEAEGNECLERHRSLHEDVCNSKARMKMNELDEYENSDDRLTAGCRTLEEFQVCTNDLMTEKCGRKVAMFVQENVMAPLSKLTAYKDCARINSCTGDKLERCVKYVKEYANRDPMHMLKYRNETEVVNVCRNYNNSLECIERYKNRCGADDQYKESLNAAINILTKTLNKYCKNEFTEDDIKMNECIGKNMKTIEENCKPLFKNVTTALKMNENDEEKNSVICRSYKHFKNCALKTMSNCAKDVVRYAKEQMFSTIQSQMPFIKDCKDETLVGQAASLHKMSWSVVLQTVDDKKMDKCIRINLKNFQESCRHSFQDLNDIELNKNEKEKTKIICRSYNQFQSCIQKILSNCDKGVTKIAKKQIFTAVQSQMPVYKECTKDSKDAKDKISAGRAVGQSSSSSLHRISWLVMLLTIGMNTWTSAIQRYNF